MLSFQCLFFFFKCQSVQEFYGYFRKINENVVIRYHKFGVLAYENNVIPIIGINICIIYNYRCIKNIAGSKI